MRINKTNVATIRCTDNINYVSIDRDGLEPITYKDIKIDDVTFIRQLNSIEYRYTNNELVLSTKKVRTQFIKPIEKSTEEDTNFLTLDIETKLRKNIHDPYLISYFDGQQSNSFYITDFSNSEDMIIAAIKSLMIKQYNKNNIYIHNLANFDGIFLLKILSKIGLTNPIFHKGKLVQITFKLNKIKVVFRDSLQMMPVSLRKLAKSFGVLNKSYFPHLFVNDNINFDYVGNVPNFSLFTDITENEYNEYKSLFNNPAMPWSLKNESIKYCSIDCISLYQIIDKFSDLIFTNFYVNIHNYATLSSLAFAIFRSNFLRKDTISQLSGEIANNIRKGYTGGSVDMYIPRGDNIFAYDVNSLYPAVMKNNVFPINNPVYFSGNIRDIFPDAFGYFYCKVTAPLNLQYPVLQTHVETKDGIRTLAGLGTFEMMLFSPEMDNAIKFGYTFEILWGYTFDRGNIFNDYVSLLYEMRKTYSKKDPMNLIAKLLLNSLYGKFGMDDLFSTFDMLDNNLFESIIKNDSVNVLDVIPISDDIKMVESISVKKVDNNLINPENQVHNVNIAIAAAVTAYARMYMANVMFEIEKLGINIYYKDTDSLYTDKPIPEHLISSTELGLFKLEYKCNNAIFLAPKVYCLSGIDGDSNKFLYKVKGLSALATSVKLTLNDFESLLKYNAKLEKLQTKWFKSLSDGNITIKDQIYTLKATDNKRQLIYNNNIYKLIYVNNI